MRSAGHDPIVQAGAMFCPECGRVAFPVDAARLDDARIIVTYPGALRSPPRRNSGTRGR
jgi:hypothetical protein